MSAVCPSCGVAVVAGYVRCPKCHAGLPMGRAKRATAEPGGTAVETRGFPVAPVAIGGAVVLVALVVVLSLRGGTKPAEPAAPPAPGPIAAIAAPVQARSSVPIVVPSPAPDPGAAAPDPGAAARALEQALRVQRLWGRAEIIGPRVDLRSGSCSDKAMQGLIANQRSVLHGAGLTRLRCVEQSGAVVFELDL